jgi:hypothetical protein
MEKWRSAGIVPPFLTSALDVNEWSASLSARFTTGTHYIGGCVGPRVRLHCRESNPGRPARSNTVWPIPTPNEDATLLIRILKGDFFAFFFSLSRKMPGLWIMPLPSKSFLIHHSSVILSCLDAGSIVKQLTRRNILENESRLAQRQRSGLISGRCRLRIAAVLVLIFRGFSKSLKTNAGLVHLVGHDHFLRSALQFIIHRNLTTGRYILGNSDSVVT